MNRAHPQRRNELPARHEPRWDGTHGNGRRPGYADTGSGSRLSESRSEIRAKILVKHDRRRWAGLVRPPGTDRRGRARQVASRGSNHPLSGKQRSSIPCGIRHRSHSPPARLDPHPPAQLGTTLRRPSNETRARDSSPIVSCCYPEAECERHAQEGGGRHAGAGSQQPPEHTLPRHRSFQSRAQRR